MIMETELMKTIKPEEIARSALPEKAVLGDDEPLLHHQGPRLKRWHLVDGRRLGREHLGQSINPPSTDSLAILHSKSTTLVEAEEGQAGQAGPLLKDQGHPSQARVLARSQPHLCLPNEVFKELLRGL